ncbi:hypothetical protein [Rhodopirellula sallentina]|uniref:Uncharacterized protein n=1 Tax=Rhodopirellula sallentina SM41 TaxID=1263870 RepID=M5TZ72_9BACT|nr:hypothetical protein [Rhodopirellula sallentina]EMI54500.1 hypothetical protein RSSM_04095 [Rhodopirellula sallentina SM41]
MSFPISPAAALGAAQLAGRAIESTANAVADFADVLGNNEAADTAAQGSDAADSGSADSSAEATDSLRGLLSDWMRQFGFQGDESVQVQLDAVSGGVQLELADASPADQARLSDLQARINNDVDLRESIVGALKQIPGESVSL